MECKFKLKLLVEKKSQKVLFAEVGKDVVDFLFGLLCLPIGSLTKLLKEESTFEMLSNTYRSWEQLDDSFLSSPRITAKNLIPVIPPPSSSRYALHPASRATQAKVKNCRWRSQVHDTFCQDYQLDKYMDLLYVGNGVTKEEIKKDGYVKDGITCFVMDDLSIVPMSPLGSIALFSKLGHTDFSMFEEKTVSMDVQQGFKLLQTSFWSKSVLTDVFIAKEK